MTAERRENRILVVTSHPIQYQAPLFRAMSSLCTLRVLFAHKVTPENQAAAEFGVAFEWDVDLTSGFDNRYLDNVSTTPSVNQYHGCDTPDVIEEIRDFEPDVVLVYGWHLKCYLQAAKACRSLGIPVVARTDSHLNTPRSRLKSLLMRVYYPWFLKRFDGFCVPGSMAARYLKTYGVHHSKVKTVPYCVDDRLFLPTPDNSDCRSSADVTLKENSLRRVLFVGKLIPEKQPSVLIEALSLLDGSEYSIECVFVGSGVLKEELETQAVRLGVHASFHGFVNQSEIVQFYNNADLLVLPSISETWGLAVNEALACGTPVVVSDRVGCHPELVEDGKTGSIFPHGDAEQLSKSIGEILSRDGVSMSHACISMSRKVSPDKCASQMTSALVWLAKRNDHV